MSLPSELRRLKNEITAYAVEFGLDFFETFFEMLDADRLNEIAAYGVLFPPALVIAGEVKCSGKVPKVAQIIAWLESAAHA